jgi:hypothetical protein
MVPVWVLAGPWFNQGVKKEAKQRKQAIRKQVGKTNYSRKFSGNILPEIGCQITN